MVKMMKIFFAVMLIMVFTIGVGLNNTGPPKMGSGSQLIKVISIDKANAGLLDMNNAIFSRTSQASQTIIYLIFLLAILLIVLVIQMKKKYETFKLKVQKINLGPFRLTI